MFATLIESLADVTVAELDTALADAKRQRDEADMRIAAITAVVDTRQLFQDHGHRSITGYLKQQLNCSGSEAGRIRARSRLCNEHPAVGDALGESRINVEAVNRLATAHRHPRAGERFAEFAATLTDHAERLEHSDLAVVVKHFINQADPDGSFRDQEFHEDQRTASVRDDDGAVSVHAFGGDPLRAAEMKKIFDNAVRAETHKDFETRRAEHGDDALAHPLPRSADQRRFDAIYEIFMRSVTAPADGKRPEPLVNLIIDPNTTIETLIAHGLLNALDDDNASDSVPVDPLTRRCQTSTGTPVHPDVVLKAMIRGSMRRVVVDTHNVVIDMGRTQRLFGGKARQAAQLLATTCGHRGCDIPAESCDIDHIDEWANDHGETNQANAMPLCGVHDRWKHREGLCGRRDRHGRIHLIRPDGTVIKPLGARDPDWAHHPPTTDGSQTLCRRLEPATERVPVRQTTWAEFTEQSTNPDRHKISPDARVEIIDLRHTA